MAVVAGRGMAPHQLRQARGAPGTWPYWTRQCAYRGGTKDRAVFRDCTLQCMGIHGPPAPAAALIGSLTTTAVAL